MKILFVVTGFPSISQTFVLNQITSLIDSGHEVEIYSSVREKLDKNHSDVDTYDLLEKAFYTKTFSQNRIIRYLSYLGILLKFFIRSPLCLLRLCALNGLRGQREEDYLFDILLDVEPILNKKYDVILCHFGPNGRRMARYKHAGFITGKVVTAFHGYDMSTLIKRYGESYYKELFEHGDAFLPISDFWKTKLISLGAPDKKTFVHRMGVDCSKFAYVERKPDLDGCVEILTVSRLSEVKGLEYAIRAVVRLAQTTNKKIRYRIVGDGPLRKKLEALILKCDAQSYIQLLGSKTHKDVVRLLAESHLFLATSVELENGAIEGIPVALMEAMACGLIPISTRYGSIPELVMNEKTGFLAEQRDVDQIFEKLFYLVNNPQEWSKYSKAGRVHVVGNFNIDTLTSSLEHKMKSELI